MHYLPLRRDLGNLEDTVGLLGDEGLRRRLTDAAHRDIVASGRFTYERLSGR